MGIELAVIFGVAAAAGVVGLALYSAFAKETIKLETIGTMSLADIFNGAGEDHHLCTITSDKLKSGIRYNFDKTGMVVVKGDLPENTEINVHNGKLYIDGNVTKDCELNASVPEETHTVTTFIPVSTGKVTTMVPQTRTVFDGFTYVEDHDPAVIVTGDVGDDVEINSNHGIHIGGSFSTDAELESTRDTGFSRVTTGYPQKLHIQRLTI